MELKLNNSTIKVHFITNTAPWWQYTATTCRWCAEDCVGHSLTSCTAWVKNTPTRFSGSFLKHIAAHLVGSQVSYRVRVISSSGWTQLEGVFIPGITEVRGKEARFSKSLQIALSWKKFILINTVYCTCMSYSHIWTGYTRTHPQHVCVIFIPILPCCTQFIQNVNTSQHMFEMWCVHTDTLLTGIYGLSLA